MSTENLPPDRLMLAATEPDPAQPGSPAERPYFSTPELGQRLDLVRHLTDNSEKILLIKGGGGSRENGIS